MSSQTAHVAEAPVSPRSTWNPTRLLAGGIIRCGRGLWTLWASRAVTNLLVLLAIACGFDLGWRMHDQALAQTRSLETAARHQEALARMQFIEMQAKGFSLTKPEVAAKQLGEDLRQVQAQDQASPTAAVEGR